MKLQWYGTASVSLETAAAKLLFDPFVPMPGSTAGVTAADFDGFRHILITHAHLDHIASLPELARREEREVYGTAAVKTALLRLDFPAEQIHVLRPGDTLRIGDAEISCYPGRHIRYDAKTLLSTLFSPRIAVHFRSFLRMGRLNAVCRERNETLAYQIRAEGKTAFLMGSLNLSDSTSYPVGADVLLLPYQGTSDLLTPASAVIARLAPQRVLLDHFDDTFPPVSRSIDTADILAKYPGVVTAAKYGEAYEL